MGGNNMEGVRMGPWEQYGELDKPNQYHARNVDAMTTEVNIFHEDERSRLWREQEFILQGRQEFYTPRSDEWGIKNSEDMQT